MPQPKKGPALGARPSHERLMLRNLARSLFEHERIRTTEAKAKLLRPYAERLITKAKKGTLHHRRQVLSVIGDRDIVHKLFVDIAPRFDARHGGYTRLVKIGPRGGDGAPMAFVELLEAGGATSGGPAGEGRRGRVRRPGRRRGREGGLPQDKPARSRAAEAGAAGTPPGRPEPEEAAEAASEPTDVTPEAPDVEAEATPDAGAEGEGSSGAGGEPGRQGG